MADKWFEYQAYIVNKDGSIQYKSTGAPLTGEEFKRVSMDIRSSYRQQIDVFQASLRFSGGREVERQQFQKLLDDLKQEARTFINTPLQQQFNAPPTANTGSTPASNYERTVNKKNNTASSSTQSNLREINAQIADRAGNSSVGLDSGVERNASRTPATLTSQGSQDAAKYAQARLMAARATLVNNYLSQTISTSTGIPIDEGFLVREPQELSYINPSYDKSRVLSDVVKRRSLYVGDKRRLITFEIPYFLTEDSEGLFVVLRVNPTNIRYEYPKSITEARTKGGFIAQTRGDELATISLSGVTGRWGVIGVQVLMAIYRAEYYSIKQFLQTIQVNGAETSLWPQKNSSGLRAPQPDLNTYAGNRKGSIPNIARRFPFLTLGQRVSAIKMYYLGWLFQGYFTDLNFSEADTQLGFFSYNLNFKVTKTFNFGSRKNIFPWQYENVLNDVQLDRFDSQFGVLSEQDDAYDDIKVYF